MRTGTTPDPPAESSAVAACSRCGRELPSGSAACPHCPPDGALTEADVATRLSRANLLRMRGLWKEAAEECAAVLQQHPGNPTAHSLLGDIHQDQGDPETAAVWYRQALELNPASHADRAKLARAEETSEARRARAEWDAVIQGRTQPVATGLLVRESLQRIAALAGAGLCGVLLVMAAFVGAVDRSARQAAEAGEPTAGWLRRRPAPLTAETSLESRALERLKIVAPGGPGQVVRVEFWPRGPAASLRIVTPARLREGLTPERFREALLRESYRYARGLASVAGELGVPTQLVDMVRVQVIGPDPAVATGETVLLFAGSIRRASLVVAPDRVTVQELDAFFREAEPPHWGLGV